MGMDFRGLWTREINVALRDLSSLSTLEDFGVCRVAASALGRYWAWSAKGCITVHVFSLVSFFAAQLNWSWMGGVSQCSVRVAKVNSY